LHRLTLLLWIASGVFHGCASDNPYRDGQALLKQGKSVDGLAKLAEAVKKTPTNTEYRAEYERQRADYIDLALKEGSLAGSKADFANAELAYRKILQVDPVNERALGGIEGVRMSKRHKVLINEAEAQFKAGEFSMVQEKVRLILIENPRQVEALALRKRLDEKLSPARSSVPMLKASVRKPITLEFRDANLKSIFEVISRTASLNFIFDRDVRPDIRATIFVRNTSIDEAIRLLLVTNQLEQKILNENTILIFPSVPAKIQDYRELIIKSFYIANADVKQTLSMIKTIVKTKDVFIDEKLNLLIMRDTPEAIRMAEKLIAAQDLGEPEVMLDVEVMEVKRSLLKEIGVQYPAQLTMLNASTSPVTTATGAVAAAATTSKPLTLATLAALDSGQIGVSPNPALNFRHEESDVNLLANPRIRVKNKEKAKIHIGERVPVITTTTSVNIGVSESVNYLDVGLKLDVEPTVTLANDVSIRVGLEVSNIVREIKSTSGTLTYQVGTRNAATVLRLRDGETQVLAGLLNDEDRSSANKLPGLGDLPLLGRLFSTRHNEKTKTEIVLLITPHIIRNINRPDSDVLEFDSGTEAMIGQRPISLHMSDVIDIEGAKVESVKAVENDTHALPPLSAPVSLGKAAVTTNQAAGVVIPGVLPSPPAKLPAPAPVDVPSVPVGAVPVSATNSVVTK
jgi:general secretion pathway protein D